MKADFKRKFAQLKLVTGAIIHKNHGMRSIKDADRARVEKNRPVKEYQPNKIKTV